MIRSSAKNPAPGCRKRISILLAEDHTVVRQGLRALLETEADIEVIGEAETGRQAVQMAVQLRPAILVLDIAMPFLNGLEAARQLRVAAPATKILVLSAHCDDIYVGQMMALGARGYLIKQTSYRIFAEAIREVEKGNFFFSPCIAEHFRHPDWKSPEHEAACKKKLSALSSREVEVLQLIAEGKANKQIAAALGISIKTIEKHRQHLMEKLNIHDTAGLTRHAIAAGVIESSVQLTVLEGTAPQERPPSPGRPEVPVHPWGADRGHERRARSLPGFAAAPANFTTPTVAR